MILEVWVDECVIGTQIEINRILFLLFIRIGIFSNWTNAKKERGGGEEKKRKQEVVSTLTYT
jgi:hypothetical protein